jgi:adenosylmethionine-8-amino-7-oxononanoate aminotransferase
MVWAFDVQTKNHQFQRDFYLQGLAQGLLLRPIGNTVYWMPPYVISPDEMDFMINTTKQLVMTCA